MHGLPVFPPLDERDSAFTVLAGLAYGLRLLGTKGRSARQRWSNSSSSMVSSPTLARSRAISSSRSSVGRLLRAA